MLIGNLYALLAALAYGIAGAAIALGKPHARGDNGVFLSVLVTAVLTGGIWLVWGRVPASDLWRGDRVVPLALFVFAGLLSTVLGRTLLFRATELTGPVTSGLMRRLTPVFGLPLGFLILAEWPDAMTFAGAGLILLSVFFYLPPHGVDLAGISRLGLWFGVGSAAAYAGAYSLRSLALISLPDAALGTLIGALAGMLWFLARAMMRADRADAMARLFSDRTRWHLMAALSLSFGQFLQFLALTSTTVVSVATLGTLEVFFAALVLKALSGETPPRAGRLAGAVALALVGTAMMLA